MRKSGTNIQFVTQSFTKMLEPRGANPLSAVAAKDALQKLETCSQAEIERSGSDAGENIFSYRSVKRALEQLLTYYEDASSSISEEDHEIYYTYAYDKLKIAEEILKSE